MSKQEIAPEVLFNEEDEGIVEVDFLADLKKSIDENPQAAVICENKKHNPNYFLIVYANQRFCEIFNLTQSKLFGKSYDFLFSDLDLDYSSEDQLEYVRLIKAVKDFQNSSIEINLPSETSISGKERFKVTFSPTDSIREELHHAVFTFEKIAKKDDEKPFAEKSNFSLLHNMERALRNERLLREVGDLIISDLQIREIAQNLAKILCQHLRADRCLIHDYQEGQTDFIAEYHDPKTKPMFKDVKESEAFKHMAAYINFQNHFYEKFGNKKEKSSLSIIEDLSDDRSFFVIKPICEEFSIVSQIAITTTLNHKITGGIYIHQSSKRTWSIDEVELIEAIADQFSIALDRSNSIERVMITNHALTEKTLQLKEALKQEQEMRKMQNEFVALVSHEFKTPLQIIDSTRELMSRKIKNYHIVDDGLDKALERIRSGIQRMNGLIVSVLNLAKMESSEGAIKLEVSNFDLEKFIREIIEKNANLAVNKNVKILFKINELPDEFNGDPKLLEHSITNVISNAIKYSRSNSTVKILAKVNDQKIAIRVIDQGIGIPRDDLKNIGQKFFRAKNTLAVAGTGIGIYLTKHFIELHGGNVLIESEVDVGTSVTIILPRNL